MIRKFAITAALLTLMTAGSALSHCEIPCGIYDDAARYDLLEEHITTMEKAMNRIDSLVAMADKGDLDYNQLIRWTMNKEDHATKFQDIVSQYFLHQRIKPRTEDDGQAYEDYQRHLELYHQMLVEAMKCKQTVDQTHIENLRRLVKESRELYFKDHGHEH
jgi:nickel superoxide dismutase